MTCTTKKTFVHLQSIALSFGICTALALSGCASEGIGQAHNWSSLGFGAPPRHAPKPKPRVKAPAQPVSPANPCGPQATAEQRLLCHGYYPEAPKGGAQ
jgi:hypothetical protein